MRAIALIVAIAACGRIGFDATGDAGAPPDAACVPVVTVTRLSAGDDYVCAQLADGTLSCWGDGSFGQLGDGTRTTHLEATAPSGLGAVSAFSTGSTHACAVRNGAAMCWGSNHVGELGTGGVAEQLSPTTVSGLTSGIAGIAAGGLNSCAWTAAGDLSCWGQYNGTAGYSSNVPQSVASGVTSAALNSTRDTFSAGHGCAILNDMTVLCWGDNTTGQLGTPAGGKSDTPSAVPGVAGATQLALGDEHTCARTSDGALWCWGGNEVGQLGTGSSALTSTPVQVTALANVADVSARGFTTCAVTGTGEVYCWGINEEGQLGTTGISASSTPLRMPIPAATQVAVTARGACALAVDGVVWCWGSPLAASTVHTSAVTPAIASVDQISAGGHVTCAHATDGSIACWGHNNRSQLGDGTQIDRSSPTPVAIAGATEVRTGGFHTCSLHGGAISCWGGNDTAQVVAPPSFSVPAPTDIPGVTGFAHVAVGTGHTAALRNDGIVVSWGLTSEGRCGVAELPMGYTAPTTSNFTGPISTIAAGPSGTCAIDGTNALLCVGRGNEGEIGDGATMDEPVGTGVSIITTTTAAALGLFHVCAIADGQVWCWGADDSGQLGDGGQANSTAPVALAIASPQLVATGWAHSCAIDGSGAVWCWGSNSAGQLGDGTLTSSRTPILATALAGATTLALGAAHTCALLADGTMRCVGSDVYGELGTGAAIPPPTPRVAAITCP